MEDTRVSITRTGFQSAGEKTLKVSSDINHSLSAFYFHRALWGAKR